MSARAASRSLTARRGSFVIAGFRLSNSSKLPSFVRVAWLLIFGRMPTTDELANFSELLTSHSLLHESARHQFQQIPVDAPPMAILSASLNNLSYYHQQFIAMEDTESFVEAAARLISKVRTIAAFSYRRSQGLPFNYPDPHLRYCENLLHMMFSLAAPAVHLHAGNCGRAEPGADPARRSRTELQHVHGARGRFVASQSVCLLFGRRECPVGTAARWCQRQGDRDVGADPRGWHVAGAMYCGGQGQETASSACSGLGIASTRTSIRVPASSASPASESSPPSSVPTRCWTLPAKLEELALKDPYFVERNLYPNVDFYSGLLLRAMGIPTNMFTVIFAIGRLPGWIAHWKEQHDDPTSRILRPRQVYQGPEGDRHRHGHGQSDVLVDAPKNSAGDSLDLAVPRTGVRDE